MIDPALEHAGKFRRGLHEIWQLIENDGAAPSGDLRLPGQPQQQTAPVAILHVGKTRDPLANCLREVPALNLRRRLVSYGVETAMAPRPLEEKPSLADPPSPVDDRQPALGQRYQPLEPLHLRLA